MLSTVTNAYVGPLDSLQLREPAMQPTGSRSAAHSTAHPQVQSFGVPARRKPFPLGFSSFDFASAFRDMELAQAQSTTQTQLSLSCYWIHFPRFAGCIASLCLQADWRSGCLPCRVAASYLCTDMTVKGLLGMPSYTPSCLCSHLFSSKP